MNIYCEWSGEKLLVKSGTKTIAIVEDVTDPCLTFCEGVSPSLTFGEMEHIMDCWHNQPKN